MAYNSNHCDRTTEIPAVLSRKDIYVWPVLLSAILHSP